MWEKRELRTRLWWGNAKETLFGIPRRRWKDNIKMGLNELIWLRTGIGDGCCEHGNEPSDAIKLGEFF